MTTDNKTLAVDVLERMRVATVFRNDLAEARGLVEELICAASDFADVEENAYDITQTVAARNRLRAAIARVKGESA
ncbi:hypothetical protein J5H43_01930 [Stenotrophomonas maltophilia]|uniref:hypothetical protein n=1 Tax=Stenotrophomonas maltophilia TaxID=40324 RepID=UPI001AAFCEA9|nr:hypothetical protein [Stenotrophomonas maltophilia]MBO3002272.1 hypothetical protein [Stenotrophomonas maltophilia]MBP1381584.1 hypothetical protein [Stenotrophomonas maltophilia]MBP1386596.1 hypothetical protein [Stenotrophomonas maltophilia]